MEEGRKSSGLVLLVLMVVVVGVIGQTQCMGKTLK